VSCLIRSNEFGSKSTKSLKARCLEDLRTTSLRIRRTETHLREKRSERNRNARYAPLGLVVNILIHILSSMGIVTSALVNILKSVFMSCDAQSHMNS